MKGYENLKIIRLEGELLPKWAQLLDLAARLCPVPEETRSWFSRFARSAGVDDARTVLAQSDILRSAIQRCKDTILLELRRSSDDEQATQIVRAWDYALETMAQQARSNQTCTWEVEGVDGADPGDGGDGDITLRRV